MTYVIFGELETLKKSFNFRQKHFSGIIQLRLDYLFTSNNRQETISNVDILNAFSTDHSPVFCSFISCLNCVKGPGFWKFNNSLICDSDFVDEMKTFIHNTKIFSDLNDTFSNQNKSEFLKYEIRKRSIAFSKSLAKKSKKEHALLLPKSTKLEQDIVSEEKFGEYKKKKNKLEKIYDNIAESVKIRSKCFWYKYGEKSLKFFCGWEKKNALPGTIKTLLEDGKEITAPSEISLILRKFYENLLQSLSRISKWF